MSWRIEIEIVLLGDAIEIYQTRCIGAAGNAERVVLRVLK